MSLPQEKRTLIILTTLFKTTTSLGDPEPDLLNPVPWEALGPHHSVQRRLAGIDISFGRIPPLGPLVHLPEDVQKEVDGHSNVISDKIVNIEATCNGVESLEEDDQTKEDQTGPS